MSRSHGDPRSEAFIDSRPNAVRKTVGSAVKFGRIAEGSADIYPRFGPTSEWDVGAGCAVVTAAGGKVTDGKGGALRFGERGDTGFIIPAFIAWGDPPAAVDALLTELVLERRPALAAPHTGSARDRRRRRRDWPRG